MLLSPLQEAFIETATQTVLDIGGMNTKYNAYPMTMQTNAGVLRIKPAFDGIYCKFDEPSRALALNIPCHRMKGELNFLSALSADEAAFRNTLEDFSAMVKQAKS